MKKKVLSTINGIFYQPLYVKYCSQTIYQTLIGCVRLYEATGSKIWLERADRVCEILISIQQPDGGFDIGYEFNFGLLHKKGESTSPELVGLSALIKYYKISKNKSVAIAAHLAAEWIAENAVKLNEDHWMIPYAPITTKEIMVYNGTSFAAGALGEYLAEFPNKKMDEIYKGMINYLRSVMSSDERSIGEFWFYSDRTRTDLSENAFNKIDYYHQMQQVEVHSEAQFAYPVKIQKEIISLASEHVKSKQDSTGRIPYLNLKSDIHVWGFCSCASGFLLAAKLSDDDRYKKNAELIYDWLEKYSWNGNYFYPILSYENEIVDQRFYVRSDAWVFNSFALAVKEQINTERYLEICENCFQKMSQVNFSGLENHASNKRKRNYSYLLKKAGKLKNTLWQK